MDNVLIIGIGVSVHKTDGVIRFEQNCCNLGLDYIVAGEGKEWKGGNMNIGVGGGQKINELRIVLENMCENKLVIICDTFDLFPVAGQNEILEKYHKICPSEKILFASEVFCWPDKNLSKKYPYTNSKYKYLNSGSFMGYRNDILKLIQNETVANTDDDQLFFTNIFLDQNIIELDYNCELFQTLSGVESDIIIHKNRVYNNNTYTHPIFIHGNGSSKLLLNRYENYINTGSSNIIPKIYDSSTRIFVAIYIDSTNMKQFYSFIILVQKFRADNITFVVYDKINNIDTLTHLQKMDILYIPNMENYAYDDFLKSNCEYYLIWEQNYKLIDKMTINDLVTMMDDNHRIVSPLLRMGTSLYTNFWGDLNKTGYYSRSVDYKYIINNRIGDLWNVPYVSGVIMIRRDIIQNWNLNIKTKFTDRDMNLCENLRQNNLFMYILNKTSYGYMLT